MNCFHPPSTPDQIIGNRLAGRSFFEPGQYKVALDRCEAANKSCEIHIDIFEDFVQVLEDFKRRLARWKENSEKRIYHSQEFGTNKDAFLKTVRAMELIGERPAEISKQIQENVVLKMKSYRETEFGRKILHSKKYRTFEESFKKAQKSWVKTVNEINEKWEEIVEAQNELDKAIRAVKLWEGDVGAEQKKREEAKKCLEKREAKMTTLSSDYANLLSKAKEARGPYEKEMNDALEATHKFERARLQEFLTSFQTVEKLMTTAELKNQSDVPKKFKEAIEKHNIESDIKHWNENYGSATSYSWGVFQPLKN